MKKKMIFAGIISSVLFSVNVLAEEVGQVDNSVESQIEVKEKEENTVLEKEIRVDATADYSIDQQKLIIGKSTKLRVKPILDVEVTGEFKEFKDQHVQIKKDGTVVALKEGTSTVAPEFVLSKESEQKIKEAYIKQPGNEKVKIETIVLTKKDVRQIFKIEVGNPTETIKHQIDITPTFSIDKEKLKVGESGKVSISPIEGVALKGKYTSSENEFIELKEDGTYTALKPTKIASLVPSFEIADESFVAIKQAYLEKPENAGVLENDVEFIRKDIGQLLSVEIEKVVVPINWTVGIDKTTIKVGETAQLSLASQYGYTPKVDYPLNEENKFVKVTKEGVVTGVKVGKANVNTTFGNLSEEEANKIKEAFIKEKKLTNVKIEDLEIGPRPSNITSVDVEVVATSTGGGNNSVGKTTSKKTYAPVKKLPKTGEEQTFITIISGFILIGTSTFYLNKRNKQELD